MCVCVCEGNEGHTAQSSQVLREAESIGRRCCEGERTLPPLTKCRAECAVPYITKGLSVLVEEEQLPSKFVKRIAPG